MPTCESLGSAGAARSLHPKQEGCPLGARSQELSAQDSRPLCWAQARPRGAPAWGRRVEAGAPSSGILKAGGGLR